MIEQHQKLILAMVHKTGRGLTSDTAEELVQIVNLALLDGKLARFDPSRGMSITTFIGMITKNIVRDHFRSQRDTVEYPSDSRNETDGHDGMSAHDRQVVNDAAAAEDALSMLLRAERATILAAAVAKLSKQDQAFMTACLADDFSIKAYAEKHGIPQVAVRVRKTRLADKLRAILENSKD